MTEYTKKGPAERNWHTLDGDLGIQVSEGLEPSVIKRYPSPTVHTSHQDVAIAVNFLYLGGGHFVEGFAVNHEYAGTGMMTQVWV